MPEPLVPPPIQVPLFQWSGIIIGFALTFIPNRGYLYCFFTIWLEAALSSLYSNTMILLPFGWWPALLFTITCFVVKRLTAFIAHHLADAI